MSDTLAIGTEVWNELDEAWKEGDTVIARTGYKWVTRWEVGKPYVINKFYDDVDSLIGIYCDVTRPVRLIDGGFEFDDLYLDVWEVAGKSIVILDEDELENALRADYITADETDEARRISQELVVLLKNGSYILQF